MGTVWQSEHGKNLTFSVLKKFESLQISHQFILNIAVSLAICDVLKTLSVPNVQVKWPNDIMSGSSKICGILIENTLKGKWIQNAVIGIGLNVNQTSFGDLEKVASLKSIMGQEYFLDELLQMILEMLKSQFLGISGKTVEQMLPAYESLLFRKDKPSTFRTHENLLLTGFIRKISPSGKLILELEDHVLKEFGLKEVSLLY